MDFLGGVKVVEETHSPINGKIQVIRSFAFGTYVQVGGLTQTGGVVNGVWKKSLKKVQSLKVDVKTCLLLGLGGGGNASIVKKFWPNSVVTGVDIDSKMIEIGKKYFGLDKLSINIVTADALAMIKKEKLKKRKYDLILIDLYVGDNYPEKFESQNFIELILACLNPGGMAVFNRLYYGEKRKIAVNFLQVLEKLFSKVYVVYPEANVMYLGLQS